ncbi:MAG TPA: YihY/virulence factor BrkB family protein, partial [Stellaceae bacterium]|nr:YihY/virulence factor BrkB family protein [Stellaceae bacterium]
ERSDPGRADPALATADAASGRGNRPPVQSGRNGRRKERLRWGRILANVYNETNRDYVSVMAAGVAFWTFLSIFPGMSALISIYGLGTDPTVIANQIASLVGVLPPSALELVSEQLVRLITAPPQALGLGLVISLLLALWYSMSGTGTLMQALTVAYEEKDTRGILAYYAQSAALTIGIAVFGLLSLFLVAIVPAIIEWLPFPKAWRDTIGLVRWPVLAVLLMLALGAIYRFAPARRHPCWHLFSTGTIVAATLWLAGSAGFSYYVANFSSYDKTYGSLGTVVVLLMWLYLSSFIVLVGAELNFELEQARSGSREQCPDPEPAPDPETASADARPG